jgi:hypothetical protein
MPWRSPTLKIASFSIVAVVCEPKLRTNEVDVAIIYNHTAVVVVCIVSDRPRVIG